MVPTLIYIGSIFFIIFFIHTWRMSKEAGYRSARSRFHYVEIQTKKSFKLALGIIGIVLLIMACVIVVNYIAGWLVNTIHLNIDLVKPDPT